VNCRPERLIATFMPFYGVAGFSVWNFYDLLRTCAATARRSPPYPGLRCVPPAL
jgi:hypothetical protein